ncbi:hypothetical protein A2415_05085 [candidate division WWE3 bacterium RIFOXYC1_FULL_39_7]|uniref:Uncharacterized protein n=2 Tax=Katanobacteria TaxID=422282 RepID=A0A1F4X7S2_UNCKA|nr:MAG: hypothetical protein A2415_05085 [candidate division WWE3 bacterium RIFOXYC1_FULL_39_7]OGC77727.1 MAG: hypothetical protein A2619_03555 [candidate division WWE3 bacterium RIFOXYD1_FULL_39_9]
MDKNYKKAILTFFISVLIFIGGVLLIDALNKSLSEDIDAFKMQYEEAERLRNNPATIIYPETSETTPAEEPID